MRMSLGVLGGSATLQHCTMGCMHVKSLASISVREIILRMKIFPHKYQMYNFPYVWYSISAHMNLRLQVTVLN